VPLTSDRTTIARTASDPVAGWRSENAAVDVSESTFEGVILVPRSLAVLVKVSRELIDDSVNIEQALEAALRGSLSVELDRVAWIRNAARAERHQVHLRHKLIGHGGRTV